MPQYLEDKTQVATGEYLKTIQRVFLKRLSLIILIAGVTAVATLITSKIIRPVYEAKTSIRVQQSPMVLSDKGAAVVTQRSLKPEAMWIASRFIVEDVMKQFGMGIGAKTQMEFLRLLEKLQENIEVEAIEGTNVLQITVHWYDPALTANLANGLAETFIEKYSSFNQAQAKETRQFVEEQLDLVKVKLDEAQAKVSQFQKEVGVFSISQEVESLSRQLTSFQTKLAEVDMDIKMARMKADQIRTQVDISDEQIEAYKSKVATLPYKAYDKSNALIEGLRTRTAQLEADIVSLSSLYTDKYPPLLQKKTELAEVKKKINEELAGIVSDVNIVEQDPYQQDMVTELVQTELQIRALEEQKKNITELIQKAQAQAGSLPDKQLAYAGFMRDERVNEEMYTLLLGKLHEAQIRENANMWDIRVFDRAYVPFEPIRPRPVRNTAFGIIIGLLLGVGLSMVIEYFDDSFRTVEDVESQLRIPVLAAIPEFRRKHIKHKAKE